ncbi:MAG TPA: response regulator transcription factor [Bacteroidetes bacterium]|nr:response regulator transcription factor [Bacteroidota bacterium]
MVNKKLKIVIADDHPIFRRGLFEILQGQYDFEVIGEAANGEQAVAEAERLIPDIVVLDIDMPVMNGLDAAGKIRALFPEMRLAILTVHNSKGPFDLAMSIGVEGYVLKENAVLDIVACLHAISQGEQYVSPQVQDQLRERKRMDKNLEARIASLTKTERNILRKIACYKTSQTIANELFVTRKTVSNHRSNINEKLGLRGNHSLLRFSIEHLDLIS